MSPEAVFAPALAAIEALAGEKGPVIAGIDGRCGSGKTALAALAADRFGCAVVHLDDFYLPPERRAPDWRSTPAGNMDLARLRREALEPFLAGRTGQYAPYCCALGRYGARRPLPAGGLLLTEGSYSFHLALADLYSLKIFLTCSPEVQRRRLLAREGAHYAAFEQTWMPLEEAYHRQCAVQRDALCVCTDGLDSQQTPRQEGACL